MKKIELDIILLYLLESIFLLFLVRESILNIIIGFFIAYSINILLKKAKFNCFTKLFYLIISIFFGLLVFYKTIDFITNNILKDYSIFLISFSFLLTSFFIIKKKHAYIKCVQLSIYLFLIIKIFKLILLLPLVDIHNLNLIKQFNININIIITSCIFFFIIRLVYLITNYLPSIKRTLIPLFNPLFIKLMIILVLGDTLFNLYEYPYVNYLKSIKYLDFIERIDGLLSFEYLLSFLVFFSFLIFSIKTIISLIKKNQ